MFLIYFCLGQKSSKPYATKSLSFTFYTNSISWQDLFYLDVKMWNNISTELKLESSLKYFKEPVNLRKPLYCPCRLCKIRQSVRLSDHHCCQKLLSLSFC